MKLIFYIVLIITGISAYGQQSIHGTITTKEAGQPLPGAIVYFPDLKQGTTANIDGKFRLNNLPAGTFLMEVKSIGYKSLIKNVFIQGDVNLDIVLEESAVEMNEVVITGSVTSTQKLLNPVPVISINHAELERNSSTNVIDALTRVPGISQVSTGNAISKPVIRGLGYNRVLVLHDDIRQEGQQWGDEHGVEIDENSIDKVEVIKGPGSLIYGSDALAGVLNFLSTPSLPEGEIKGEVLANFQSNNRLMEYSANQRGNINGVNWLLRGTYAQAANFRNKYDGIVFNSGYSEKNVNGNIGLTKSWGYSFLRFSTFNEDLGMIEGERDSTGQFIMATENGEAPVTNKLLHSYKLNIPRQQLHHNRIQLNSKILVGNGSVQTDIGFQNNVRKEFADPLYPENAELYFNLNTFSYDARYNFPNVSEWRNIAGISGMVQKNSNSGEELLIPDYRLNDAGIFFTTHKTWENLHLAAGIRFDQRKISSQEGMGFQETDSSSVEYKKFEAFEKNFSNISFGIGISRNITPELVWKLNYSKGFRAPNLAELATNGKHEGTFRYEYGNKDLKSESSHQIDAGVLYNSHHIAFEVNSFVNNVQHFIFLEKLTNSIGEDSIPDPKDAAPAFKFIQGNAVLYGGEISLDIHPHPYDFLHVQQTFSIVKGILKNQTDSTNLPLIPASQYRAEVRIQPKKIKGFHNPYISVEYRYFFPKKDIYSAFESETATPDYSLINVGVGADIFYKKQNLATLNFQITNLLDVAYQSHLSRLKYAPVNPSTGRVGIYNPGRSFNIKLIVPVSFRKSH